MGGRSLGLDYRAGLGHHAIVRWLGLGILKKLEGGNAANSRCTAGLRQNAFSTVRCAGMCVPNTSNVEEAGSGKRRVVPWRSPNLPSRSMSDSRG